MIGRRLSELLGLRTKLEPKTDFSLLFTGQLKHQGELAAFEIPTLCPASTVLSAWKRLKFMLGSEQLDPKSINQRIARNPKTGLRMTAKPGHCRFSVVVTSSSGTSGNAEIALRVSAIGCRHGERKIVG